MEFNLEALHRDSLIFHLRNPSGITNPVVPAGMGIGVLVDNRCFFRRSHRNDSFSNLVINQVERHRSLSEQVYRVRFQEDRTLAWIGEQVEQDPCIISVSEDLSVGTAASTNDPLVGPKWKRHCKTITILSPGTERPW